MEFLQKSVVLIFLLGICYQGHSVSAHKLPWKRWTQGLYTDPEPYNPTQTAEPTIWDYTTTAWRPTTDSTTYSETESTTGSTTESTTGSATESSTESTTGSSTAGLRTSGWTWTPEWSTTEEPRPSTKEPCLTDLCNKGLKAEKGLFVINFFKK